MLVPAYQPTIFQRGVQKLAAMRFFSMILSHTLHHLDPAVLRVSRGKYTATSWMTGLPVIWLTTTGARTEQKRTIPLVGIPDGELFVLIATNFGKHNNPAWYHNLKAKPYATIQSNGMRIYCRAQELEGSEYDRVWHKAVERFHGYANYAARTKRRKIPVLTLTPIATDADSYHLDLVS